MPSKHSPSQARAQLRHAKALQRAPAPRDARRAGARQRCAEARPAARGLAAQVPKGSIYDSARRASIQVAGQQPQPRGPAHLARCALVRRMLHPVVAGFKCSVRSKSAKGMRSLTACSLCARAGSVRGAAGPQKGCAHRALAATHLDKQGQLDSSCCSNGPTAGRPGKRRRASQHRIKACHHISRQANRSSSRRDGGRR